MFSKLKDIIAETKENGVPISLPASVFNTLIERYPIDTVDNVKLHFDNQLVVVTGTTKVKKLGISKKVDFTLQLRAIGASGRKIQFEIESLKPLNINMINNKIFDHPPISTFDKGVISVNLNAIEQVKKVPVGTIKSFDIQDEKLTIRIGL